MKLAQGYALFGSLNGTGSARCFLIDNLAALKQDQRYKLLKSINLAKLERFFRVSA
jgi:hypothetical protein